MNRTLGRLTGILLWCWALAATAEIPADAVWIDVRSHGEFVEDHLAGATQVPFDGIEKGVMQLQLDKDRPIYLYCGSGHRAGIAKERLEKLGYGRVVNVGGLEDARELLGRPAGN